MDLASALIVHPSGLEQDQQLDERLEATAALTEPAIRTRVAAPRPPGSLLRAYYVSWSPAIANAWIAILQCARSDCHSPRAKLQLSVQSLQYALSNSRYPLSAVVATTFLDVYQAVTAPNGPPSETSSLFGWITWGKGKELKSLIDTFIYSQWPPGDSALAVNVEANA